MLHAALAAVVALAAAPSFADRVISAQAYYDKLYGSWLGQLIAIATGIPTEGYFANQYPNPDVGVPWVTHSIWPTDDASDIEYFAGFVFRDNGLQPGSAALAAEWAAHVPPYSVFFANREAAFLMLEGRMPPESGSFHWNPYYWAIDPQLTTEAIGAASPGLRQWAINTVGTWSHITTDGMPVHAAQFYAAMYAAAAFESDVPTLIQRGLEAIPASSRTAWAVQDVLGWYAADMIDGLPDWRATRALIYHKYRDYNSDSGGRYQGWYESTVNVAATVLGLLYGGGLYEDTVQITILAGWDTDCNASSAGGLVGMIVGYSGLPASLTSQCGDIYRNDVRPDLPLPGPLPQDDSLTAICQRWQAIAEQVLVSQGGWIEGSGPTRVYHIPDEAPLITEPESWDPSGPRGLVGRLAAQGQPVTVTARIAKYNPDIDRDRLTGIIDGITDPRYNGHKAYSTQVEVAPPVGTEDYYQINFGQDVWATEVVFHEGDFEIPGNSDVRVATFVGGYFETLVVELRRDGAWVAPVAQQSEALDRRKAFQTIAFNFAPQRCDAVRIRGIAGGSQRFTTIMELEVNGSLTPIYSLHSVPTPMGPRILIAEP